MRHSAAHGPRARAPRRRCASAPRSGLDLTRRFDRSIGFFWSATHQQIYRVLAPDGGRRLGALDAGRADRAARQEGVRRRRRPARACWPTGSPSPPRWSSSAASWRSSCAARRTATARPCSPRSREHRADHATRLAHYEQLAERDYPDPSALTGHDLDQYLVLRGGIRLEQFWVDWLTEYLDAHARRPHERLPPPARAAHRSATSRCATAW